jgi:hypothetical protein
VLRIDADENDIAVALLERVETVLEAEDFGRTDEGEGCWNEEEDQPVWRFGGWVDVSIETYSCGDKSVCVA